jgi:hypothetical protein
LEIEALANRRLADEYDAAQERGDAVGPHDGHRKMKRVVNPDPPGTLAEYGLTKQQIHEARQIRDAEARDPGIVPMDPSTPPGPLGEGRIADYKPSLP